MNEQKKKSRAVTLGILKGTASGYQSYVDACEEMKVEYQVVDILAPDWIEQVKASRCDGFLARPPHSNQDWKTIYDEKLYIISDVLGYPVYPSFTECYIYESKRMMAYWLQANGFPMPRTLVVADRSSAFTALDEMQLPCVIKANVGSAGTRVDIIRSRARGRRILKRYFGIRPYLAPGYFGWTRTKGIPLPAIGLAQRHSAIIQEFIPSKWEWRILKLGDSYFGHQKLLKGEKASGSHQVGWVAPPRELLFLMKDLCEKGNFRSMNADILESTNGRFYINELQSLFGAEDNSQMYIDGKPGRYVFRDGTFVFEDGYFCQHSCCLLRVKDFIEQLQ